MADTTVSEFPVERVAARRQHGTDDREATVAASGTPTRTKADLFAV